MSDTSLNNKYNNWTYHYNSIYFLNKKNYLYGLKEYNQHTILSYHYVNNE